MQNKIFLIKDKKNILDVQSFVYILIGVIISFFILTPIGLGFFSPIPLWIMFFFFRRRYKYIITYEIIGTIQFIKKGIIVDDGFDKIIYEFNEIDDFLFKHKFYVNYNWSFNSISNGKNKFIINGYEYDFLIENENQHRKVLKGIYPLYVRKLIKSSKHESQDITQRDFGVLYKRILSK